MMNKKAVYILIGAFLVVALGFAGYIAWQKDVGFIQERLIRAGATSKTISIKQGLAQEEIQKLAIIPESRPIKKPISALNTTTQQLLKKANLDLYYQANKDDVVGRSLLVPDMYNRKNFNYEPAFGGSKIFFDPLSPKDGKWSYWRETGLFKSWVAIAGSRDQYVLLTDVDRGIDFLVRIVREDGECMLNDKKTNLTELVVRDIGVSTKFQTLADIGPLSGWPTSDIGRIILSNDMLVIWNLQYAKDQWLSQKKITQTDHNGVACASAVIIQRFGGISQLEKELTRSLLSAPPSKASTKIYDYYQITDSTTNK